MSITENDVKTALSEVIDPNTQKDFITTKSIKNIKIDGAQVTFELELGYPAASQVEMLRGMAAAAVLELPGVEGVAIRAYSKIVSHTVQRGMKVMPNVKNIIAVASGKGGVGKSTTAVNLALALSAEGASVGILDADIYGPSQPMMLGVSGRPVSHDNKSMEPLENHGIQVSSVGFMIDPDEPMVWRGPMASGALQQLLEQTNWRDLDYLIVDMPPGTGDIQLTLSQKVPVTGAVIVTTPQDLALLDARKGVEMFRKVNIPVLGVVENMAVHICSSCGHAEHLFGEGGGEKLAAQFGVDLLASMPLSMAIRLQADGGKPTTIADPESQIAMLYQQVARMVGARIATGAAKAQGMPNIVIADD